MKSFIGIDLGTTNTTCNILIQNEDGICKAFPLPIKHAHFKGPERIDYQIEEKGILPSSVIVSENDNRIYCGTIDQSYTALQYHAVLSYKTKLSDSLWKMKVGNKELTAIGFSAAILFVIHESLKDFNGENGFAFDISTTESITITIPASFSSKMRG